MRIRASKWCKGLTVLLATSTLVGMYPSSAATSDYKLGYSTNASENGYIFATKSPKGTIGKSIPIPFHIRATDGDMENLRISLLETNEFQQIEERGNGGYSVDYYPFGIMETTFVAKNVGTIKKDNIKSVSPSARVRRDTLRGYYSIPVLPEWNGGSDTGYVNVRISTPSTSGANEEEDKKEGGYFVVRENQPTPRDVYPNVMDYAVNFRSKRETTAQDVTVNMQLSEDDAKFPSETSGSNYNHTFKRMQSGGTMSAPYSMAICKDSYTGYYPIKYTITFRLSSGGDLRTEEGIFYVHITSKDKEGDLGNFSANDRTRARPIVESYHAIPGEIYAGDGFELILNMKNASTSVAASNTLFSLESKKVLDGAVFTMESGISSLVMDDMTPGQTTEARARLTAGVGAGQRSCVITVKEKYDSPEFKNVEESAVVDIPVKQYARLSTSTIDVMPDSLTVGSESNIVFGINNTGRVILYNMTVTFRADSVKTTDAYVRDIKSGEASNVNTMLADVTPTLDEGTVRIRIDYEDENGVPAEPVEKELTLMVMEKMKRGWDDIGAAMDTGSMETGAAPSFWGKYKFLVVAGAAAAAGIAAAVVIRIRKKRKAARKEDVDDETS